MIRSTGQQSKKIPQLAFERSKKLDQIKDETLLVLHLKSLLKSLVLFCQIIISENLPALLLCVEQAPLKFGRVFYRSAITSLFAAFRSRSLGFTFNLRNRGYTFHPCHLPVPPILASKRIEKIRALF